MSPPDLYALSLDRFTAERDARAKELKAAGKSDEAAALAKLRKPTLAAWAVNQLVRKERKLIDALVKAGDKMISAQEKLLAGKADAAGLRAARAAEQKALEALLAKARKLGVSGGPLERVAETLEAAALDDGVREQVMRGELVRELRREGFGLGGLELVAAAPAAKPREAPDLVRERKEAKAELRRCHQAAARAAKALEAAESRRKDALSELEEADSALAAARKTAEAAVAAVREAETRIP